MEKIDIQIIRFVYTIALVVKNIDQFYIFTQNLHNSTHSGTQTGSKRMHAMQLVENKIDDK